MTVRKMDLFAVQMHFTLADYASSAAFAAKMTGLFEKIDGLRERDRRGRFRFPALAVFPEHIGTFLLIAPYYKLIQNSSSIDEALRRICVRRWPGVVWHRARYNASTLRALFLMTARSTYEIYFRTFSTLARRHQISVVAGSLLVPDNLYGAAATFRLDPPRTGVYNLSLTFDPRGEVAHAGKKVNLVKGLEDLFDLTAGELEDQRPFEISGGRVGNMICYDGFLTGHEPAFVPVGSRLAGLGAEILAQPSANAAPWAERWAFGQPERPVTQAEAWLEHGLRAVMVEQRGVRYGINPMLNGRFFDLSFEGQSTILGRNGADEPVVLARAAGFGDSPESEEILKVEASLPARPGQSRAGLEFKAAAGAVSLPPVAS